MRTVSCGMLAVILLAGCSSEASGDAAPDTAQSSPARDDACALLSLAEIRRILPGAARTERNDRLASQGINACSWYGSGKAPVLDVSVWDSAGADDTPMENARTLAMGVGPVRLEKITGVGDEAVVMVEKADAARGILTTASLLTFGKNGRIVTVASSEIATRDRAAALKDLTTLGKAIAARL